MTVQWSTIILGLIFGESRSSPYLSDRYSIVNILRSSLKVMGLSTIVLALPQEINKKNNKLIGSTDFILRSCNGIFWYCIFNLDLSPAPLPCLLNILPHININSVSPPIVHFILYQVDPLKSIDFNHGIVAQSFSQQIP